MSHLRAAQPSYRRVQIMGVVNRTPDSFSDGGEYLHDAAGRGRVDELVAQQADWVDIGAESTRPGSEAVSAKGQIARIGGLIAYARERGAAVSIDTTSPEVAAWALSQGAAMVNSVSLDHAERLGELAHGARAALVLTHCRGTMAEMAGFSVYDEAAYDDLLAEVVEQWRAAADKALAGGLATDALIFDPGLGFAKNATQSLELCARLGELKAALGGHRMLVGASRKSYLAAAVAAELHCASPPPTARLGASIAAAIAAAEQGADIVRVHDVAETRQALGYSAALQAMKATSRGRSASRTQALGDRNA